MQGLKDYYDAFNALTAFRSLIQSKCQQATSLNRAALDAAVGAKLEYEPYERPYEGGYSIGIRAPFKGASSTELGQCFTWDVADNAVIPGICLWVYSQRKSIEALRQALKDKAVDFDEEGSDSRQIFLYEQVDPAKVANLDAQLDKLVKKWIALWHAVGGIQVMNGKSA